MKRYCRIAIAVTIAAMLSACSSKSDEPATEKEKDSTELVVQTQPESREPDIRIQEEEPTLAEPETSAPESTQAAEPSKPAETKSAQTKTAAVKETEPAKVYSVKAFESTMYATASVNVRANYTTQSEVLTSLSPGQKVLVTGKSANGWMRIIYDGQDAYVYQKYLADQAPQKKSETAPKQTPSPDVTVYPGSVQDDPVTTPGELPIVAPAPVTPAPVTPSPGQSNSVMEYGPGMVSPGGGQSQTVPGTPGYGPG